MPRRTPTRSVPAPRPPLADSLPVRVVDRAWLRVLERIVGNWAPTLWQSVALLTLFLVAAVTVIITLGEIGVVLVSGPATVLIWRHLAARVPRR